MSLGTSIISGIFIYGGARDLIRNAAESKSLDARMADKKKQMYTTLGKYTR